ncbi:MAG: hypothetical protein ABI700_07690 [Chloroflexota bacterium]
MSSPPLSEENAADTALETVALKAGSYTLQDVVGESQIKQLTWQNAI